MMLEGRVAIVSGIGPGLGRSVALACAREGADVVLSARTAAALDAVAEEVRALGRRAIGVPSDITREEDCRKIAAGAVEAFGRIDVVVQNAFLSSPYELVEDANLDHWRKIFEVNVFGSLSLVQAMIPQMKAQKGGAIVLVNSMSVRIIEPRFGGYAASKGALATAAQTLARELGPAGIRVNSVVPGYIWGPAVQGYFRKIAGERGITPEAVYAEVAMRTALNRIPTSDEIANAVVFLASDLASAITGQALDVNGGQYFH